MKRVVYTALVGRYERLIQKPNESGEDTDYLCFSDDANAKIPGWQTIHIDPLFPGDPVRSARALKIRGHEVLLDYNESLWLDNRIELLAPSRALFELLLPPDEHFGAPLHSFRSSITDEFEEILRYRYDDPRRVREQFAHYREHAPMSLQQKPIWTAIIARRNTTNVHAFNTRWFDHVLRYSRRDQLSIRCALDEVGLRANCVEIDNIASPYHQWVDENSMNRSSDFSRWGTEAKAQYSARDWFADSAHLLRRRAAAFRVNWRRRSADKGSGPR